MVETISLKPKKTKKEIWSTVKEAEIKVYGKLTNSTKEKLDEFGVQYED
ncbi:MAG: hypothetical protein U5J95_02490 [Balneolaceae bacterium]|nr:hypothetical protein [Balneolaceae bacterium]